MFQASNLDCFCRHALLVSGTGVEDMSLQHSAPANHSPYGSAERSFRNQTEASEEAALSRQVILSQ